MLVIKRNNQAEQVQFDKILFRLKAVSEDLRVDSVIVAQKVVSGLYDGIKTQDIDTLIAETAAVLTTEHPDYSKLASRVAVSNLHKQTKNFYQTMKDLYKAGILSSDFIKLVKLHGKKLEKQVDYTRDFNLTYFAFKTLEKSYLLKIDNIVVERVQHLFMRTALQVAGTDFDHVLATYDLISKGYYTHATPTLFNSGTTRPQLASCFLMSCQDSIDGIYDALKEAAQISKFAGGIGIHMHNIRSKGSKIKGTNGISSGIVPMLKVWNETARYVDQAGKRKGSIAIYLEPWHADIEDVLQLKKPTGKDELRARDLFYALWVPDLFMKRVEADGVWSLMCPNECPGLSDTYGDEFEALYNDYEAEGKYRKQVRARDLMVSIIEAQIETGGPYFLFKDSINRKSNQKNIGMIKSSNLCTEIVEVSNENEIAVCNLASICLSKYVKDGAFDYEELHRVTKIATYNLNHVIDLTFYPLKKTAKSNLTHRPIGLGVQGLADVFFLLDLPFESQEALDINKKIFETIYHAALEASCELAERDGPYTTFKGSPTSEGILHFDYYDLKPDMYDWDALKAKIKEKGLRNSLLVAPMPTASTAQIFDNKEAFEAQGANISKREVLAGEFIVVNKYLIRKLEDLHLWNKEMRDKIINGNGSIQHIKEIPENIREIYKTVWEISQKTVIDMAADRGMFVDQSQSMNLHLADPNVAQVNSALFHGWKRGLKTGLYYLRSKAAMTAQKVTTQTQYEKEEDLACSLDNPEDCVACSA
jgi:ribonucleoside-diphosphate reductase alpha subunit